LAVVFGVHSADERPVGLVSPIGEGFVGDVVQVRTVWTVGTASLTEVLFHDRGVPPVFSDTKDVVAGLWVDRELRRLVRLVQFLSEDDRVAEFVGRYRLQVGDGPFGQLLRGSRGPRGVSRDYPFTPRVIGKSTDGRRSKNAVAGPSF